MQGLPLADLAMLLAMLAPLWLAAMLVSISKDSLMRQHFVMLQMVKLDKDRTIHKLASEKSRLVRLAQASVSSQHIKLVGCEYGLRTSMSEGLSADKAQTAIGRASGGAPIETAGGKRVNRPQGRTYVAP